MMQSLEADRRALRLVLVGFGRMGQAVAAAAKARGHQVVATIDTEGARALAQWTPAQADVVVDFTHPAVALAHIEAAIRQGLPIVVGTTGWLDHLPTVRQWVAHQQGSVLYGSNFSVGVNLLFALNQMLARLMAPHAQYDVALEEHHHRYKADAPSGTARTLAEAILQRLPRKTRLADPAALRQQPPAPDELTIGVIRAGEIPGTHTVRYTSTTDSLTLTHTAHTRDGFAQGAVLAAEWLVGRQGLFEFSSLFQGEGLDLA